MIENWKKQLDNDKKVGVIFIDLSKTFDLISNRLLLAKLKAYGFPKVTFAADFREAYLTGLLVTGMR